jgi:hypothetical protein
MNMKYLSEALMENKTITTGDWGLGPIPNPQSPIPPSKKKKNLKKVIYFIIYFLN